MELVALGVTGVLGAGMMVLIAGEMRNSATHIYPPLIVNLLMLADAHMMKLYLRLPGRVETVESVDTSSTWLRVIRLLSDLIDHLRLLCRLSTAPAVCHTHRGGARALLRGFFAIDFVSILPIVFYAIFVAIQAVSIAPRVYIQSGVAMPFLSVYFNDCLNLACVTSTYTPDASGLPGLHGRMAVRDHV